MNQLMDHTHPKTPDPKGPEKVTRLEFFRLGLSAIGRVPPNCPYLPCSTFVPWSMGPSATPPWSMIR